MRTPWLVVACLALSTPAAAFEAGEPSVTTLPDGRALATPRLQSGPRSKGAWDRFVTASGGRWRAIFDSDKGTPLRIWGSGIAAPKSVADATVAELFARAALRAHVDLLAPGASPEDFELAGNVLSEDGVRSVGFFQNQGGLRVDGGQVSFRFKHDRLVVLGSEAWPRLDLPAVERTIGVTEAAAVAKRWIAEDLGAGRVERVSAPMIRAVVLEDQTIRAATVRRVVVRTTKPVGRWEVDVEVASGRPFARRQTLMFAEGSLLYSVPERNPSVAERVELPAILTDIRIDGQATRTDEAGNVTFTSSGAAALVAHTTGALVRVINEAGAEAEASFTIADGEAVVWDARSDEEVDAQLITFIASHHARDYVKAIAPSLRFLDQQLEATVNIDDECNAFSDGTTINFFKSSTQCENTGRLPDVVRHEYGHAVHAHAVIPGVGAFDSALSEGASDYLAATIVSDPGMGRGFFRSDEPLRHLDPVGDEAVYPDDVGESHVTGLIFGGALWDLRKVMIEKYGQQDGVRLVDRWWYATMERASGITTAYVEVILADDDDGDLMNGTPNVCDISAAFDLHGIALGYTPGPTLGELVYDRGGILLPVGQGSALCPAGEYVRARLSYQFRGQPDSLVEIEMQRTNEGFGFEVPTGPEGEVLQYAVELELGTGRVLRWPDNPADPMYEVFLGEVRKLYCTDFETDPFLEGWNSEMLEWESSRATDEWEWGRLGPGFGSGDPLAAYSGSNVIGQDLGNDSNGRYQRDKVEVMRSPIFPVRDEHLRLQYYRWLTVEDGDADQAEVLANGQVVWSNLASGSGEVHHIDREWRFHDVELSAQTIPGGELEVTFSMTTNRFGSTGGWTIDDFCIVAWDGPSAICGDGVKHDSEICDDGNQLAGDGCEADCTASPAPVCGNGTVEMAEACDDGNAIDGDGCEATCIVTPAIDPNANMLDGLDDAGCGCTSTHGARGGLFLFVVGALALVVRRRR